MATRDKKSFLTEASTLLSILLAIVSALGAYFSNQSKEAAEKIKLDFEREKLAMEQEHVKLSRLRDAHDVLIKASRDQVYPYRLALSTAKLMLREDEYGAMVAGLLQVDAVSQADQSAPDRALEKAAVVELRTVSVPKPRRPLADARAPKGISLPHHVQFHLTQFSAVNTNVAKSLRGTYTLSANVKVATAANPVPAVVKNLPNLAVVEGDGNNPQMGTTSVGPIEVARSELPDAMRYFIIEFVTHTNGLTSPPREFLFSPENDWGRSADWASPEAKGYVLPFLPNGEVRGIVYGRVDIE